MVLPFPRTQMSFFLRDFCTCTTSRCFFIFSTKGVVSCTAVESEIVAAADSRLNRFSPMLVFCNTKATPEIIPRTITMATMCLSLFILGER